MGSLLASYTRALDTPAIHRFCDVLNVPKLPPNLPIVLASAAGFFGVQYLSGVLSERLFPRYWKTYSRKTKLDWELHATGWVHALISTPLSLYMILRPSPQLVRDPIYGYAPFEGGVIAISGGYFLYDWLISAYLLPTHGVPFFIHATSCCFIFLKAFTPLLNGFTGSFLVWELSTLFLHIHWWLDKLNMTGTKLQLVNGIFLLASFFGARICYGIFNTVKLWKTLNDPRLSTSMKWGFRLASLALCSLNINWFRLMIASLQKRLQVNKKGKPGDGKRGKAQEEERDLKK